MCNMMPKTNISCFLLIGSTVYNIIKVNCQKGPCIDNSETGCCAGTTWNGSLGKCVECRPGYVGFQCAIVCPYPYHGRSCSSTCNCSEYECSPSSGCVDDTNEQNTHSAQTSTSDFLSRPVECPNTCNSACGFIIPTYGIIIIVLCLVSVVFLTAFITFIVTKLTYTKAQTKSVSSEYRELQKTQNPEHSYDKIEVSNVFTGVSNVHIMYEQSNKMYSINLDPKLPDKEKIANVQGNSEYDDCANVEAGQTTGTTNVVGDNDSDNKIYESTFFSRGIDL